MKKGSLTRKSGWRLAVLGLVLFLCTSLVSGFEFYCQNIDTYTDLANSYVFLASTNVRGDMILQIEERGEELAELCRSVFGCKTVKTGFVCAEAPAFEL